MNIEYKLAGVKVHPSKDGKSNVVAAVSWQMVASRNGHQSISVGETYLPLGDLSNFTPIEQLQKDQLLKWAFDAEGGEQFIQMLLDHHERTLTYEERQVGVEPYLGPLAFELDNVKNQNMTGEIPVETL